MKHKFNLCLFLFLCRKDQKMSVTLMKNSHQSGRFSLLQKTPVRLRKKIRSCSMTFPTWPIGADSVPPLYIKKNNNYYSCIVKKTKLPFSSELTPSSNFEVNESPRCCGYACVFMQLIHLFFSKISFVSCAFEDKFVKMRTAYC